MEHRYSLDEIDRMRAALRRKFQPAPPSFQTASAVSYVGKSPFDYYQEALAAVPARAEDELRTCMMGGVRPEELEERYPVPE